MFQLCCHLKREKEITQDYIRFVTIQSKVIFINGVTYNLLFSLYTTQYLLSPWWSPRLDNANVNISHLLISNIWHLLSKETVLLSVEVFR